MDNMEYTDYDYSEQSSTKSTNNKKGMPGLLKVLIPLVLVAVILLAAGVANASKIKGLWIKTFGSAADYYQYVEEKNIDTMAKGFSASYDNLVNVVDDVNNKGYSLGVSAEVGEAGEPYLGMLSSIADIDLSWLKNCSVKTNISSVDGNIGLNGNVNINDTNITTIEAGYDSANSVMYAGVPELNSTYLSTSVGSDVKIKEIIGLIDRLVDELPDRKIVQDIISNYGNLIVDNLDEVEKESSEISVSLISQSCDAYTVKINEDTIKRIINELVDELKKDDDIKNIFIKNVDAVIKVMLNTNPDIVGDMAQMLEGQTGESLYSAFVAGLDQLKIAAESELTGIGELTMVVYINSSGMICGRTIEAGGFVVDYRMPMDGKDFEIYLSVSGPGLESPLEIMGSGTISGKKMNCDLTANNIDGTQMNYSIIDLDLDAYMDGFFRGTVRYDLSSIMNSIGDELGDVAALGNIVLEYTADMSRDKGTIAFKAKMNDSNFATITVDMGIIKPDEVNIPDSGNMVYVDDEENMLEWVKKVNFDKLIASLEEVGVDSGIIDYLRQISTLLSMGI